MPLACNYSEIGPVAGRPARMGADFMLSQLFSWLYDAFFQNTTFFASGYALLAPLAWLLALLGL